jgi:type I restriction enzyme S subunit
VCIGATIGKVCLTSTPSQSNQQINSIIVDQSRFDPLFVYYRVRMMREEFKKRAAGAATPILNKSVFSEIPIKLPVLATQRYAGAMLGAYDDLIEVNCRRIALLEEMARRLYEEWFVHFRFPGAEHCEIGKLPAGWKRAPISEIYEGLFDGPHATPAPSHDGPVFLGIGNLAESGRLDLATVRHISEDEFPRWTKRVLPREGDIVFTYEATLNRYAIIPKGFRGCLGRRLALIRLSEGSKYRNFLFLTFFSKDWRDIIARNTLSGATVDRIPLSRFPDFPISIPTEGVIEAFDEVASPIISEISYLSRSNSNLSSQRDLILPRLISGELPITAAERELEHAA